MRAALLALGLLAAAAPAQDADLATWAQLLVDHPLAARGDRDAVARSTLGLLRDEPAHPLAEAALRLLELQLPELDDPQAVGEEVLALDAAALRAAGLSPPAARQLQRLQGQLAAAYAPSAALGADLFPGFLSRFMVLGPLPDAGDPLELRAASPEFTDPGLDREHATVGLAGKPARWVALARSPLRPCVMAESVLDGTLGWALLACAFDAPGGPAFVEVETSAAGGQAFAIGTAGGGRGRTLNPFGSAAAGGLGSAGDADAHAYSFSLNGEPAIVVDPRGRPGSPLRAHPVVLRNGRNRLVFAVPMGEHGALAVRVLGPDGWPLELLVEARPGDPLGEPVAGTPPAAPPPRSVDVLSALPVPGVDEQALLGVLLGIDGRPAEGLAHVQLAQAREPARPGLQALLARRTLASDYLPDTWRRNTARALAESVVEQDPLNLAMALHVAGLVADEDREPEAVARLTELSEALPARSDALLQLATVYRKLDMDAQAEDALRRAADRTPGRPDVLRRLADLLGRQGRRTEAAGLELAALRAGGATARGLQSVAARLAALGRGADALELLREAVARDDAPSGRLALAGQLADLQRLDEADALLAALAQVYPRWLEPVLLRADLAGRRGDTAAERARLEEALARNPSQRPARERLAELGVPDAAEALFAAEALDLEALRRLDVDAGSEDSVVKIVDSAILHVWPDGSRETLTQDLYRVRDLKGCEQMGELRLPGEVLRVATIKPDGTEFEPVLVQGAYVMPSLQPGDCIVTETRVYEGAPPDGVVRLGGWYFASPEQPFGLSRYVVSVPRELPLRLVERNVQGVVTHEQHASGDAVVHVFEAMDQPRMLDEPHAPPPKWWLPWIEFGMDDDVPRHLAQLALGAREPVQVTPEIRAAADKVLAGVQGDEARARALHAFVNTALDQRGWQGATSALLGREGSGTFLYSALLAAADVPHELVWSRGVAPEADEEPDPPFVESGYWSRKLLVLVEPRDGPAAWCDLDSESLPYGRLMHDAPGAPAVALPSRRLLTVPAAPMDDRPTFDFALQVQASSDGSAQVQATAVPRGGLEWVYKENLRQAPAPLLKKWVQEVFASVAPGIDLSRHDLPGLREADVPLTLTGEGRVAHFLDDDGSSLSCQLPMPPLDLGAELAGGEGRRRLPYFLPEAVVQYTDARITLPPGLDVLELPAGLSLAWKVGRYDLTVQPDGSGGITVRRRVALPPFAMEPDEYAAFADFCAQVDAAERGRLRLARPVVDPPGGDR
jgi:hypothetical protein